MIFVGHNTKIPRDVNRFPDGTLSLGAIDYYDNLPDMVNIDWRYEGDDELFTLMCIRDYIPSNIKVCLTMYYIPHARLDRVELAEVFTLKTFCKIINNMNFYKVYVLDPHSNVSVALLDRVELMPVKSIIYRTISDINSNSLSLFYPDEGAMKRYSKKFGIPYSFGIKKRDWKTGKILSLEIMQSENVKDKDVLIIDDICSYGGTFYHAAEALREVGVRDIYLYITHAETNMLKGQMYESGLIKHIYTTDSIFNTKADNVTVFSI